MLTKRFRYRRGSTSMMEVVVCSLIFSMLLMALIMLVNASSSWGMKSQLLMLDTLNLDATVEFLQDDVKTAESVIVDGGDLVIQQADRLITYNYAGGSLYRNSVLMMDRLSVCTFTPSDGNSVVIYLATRDGDIMNFTLYR